MAKTSKNALTIDGLLQESNYLSTIAPCQILQNWCWTSLGKVCELGKGTSINHKSLPYWDAKSLRGMKEPDIIDSGIVVNAGEKVILVDGENSGEVFSIFEQGYMGSTFRTLHFSKVANEEYATFFIDFHRDQLRKSKIGSAIPHLNKELFFELPFPLPPLAEQKRIVDRIESLFSKLDEAKEKAQTVVDGFEDRKAAILHKAFTGDLTAEWRKSFNGADWERIKIGTYLKPMETKKPAGDRFLYIDIDSIDNKRQEVRAPKDTLVRDAPSRASRAVHRGDVLFSIVRPYLKNIALIDESLQECIASTGFYVCTPRDGLDSKYLYYLLCSKDAIDYLMQFMKGDNSPSIRKDDLLNMQIMLPSNQEQIQIVQILDDVLEHEHRAKKAAEQVIDQIDTMKKSILARAFRGELSTNDPNDEPAIELLKK